MNATNKIDTFHDGYGWCIFINGNFFGRWDSRLEGCGRAMYALEGKRWE
jgi:hypothetical protein